ncbi:aldehyde dehydrogenase [Oceanibacterium hippocampi]|uniref:Lactaldehyde dehydrogenase n=1 Tax=Oceanibacterium hippocampi TaxID=745714 RepID=A0A1Y5TRH3_9PROT|nr:aldehyde dehydrogenase [Oceanibacterium hippocampi]SLN66506.1 Lactaldehyde dehydrogenase [Oceanibacterium hippocampi]
MNTILKNFIDGRYVDAASADVVEVLNPATGVVFSAIPDSGEAEVAAAVAAAGAAQGPWAKLPAVARGGYLKAIAAKIREKSDLIARTVVREQGKPLGLAVGEVAFAADYFDYMAEWARRLEGEVISSDRPGETILMLRQPIGVVGGILPWNFPFFLLARKVAPALITGNTVVIKPSEETPVSADLFVQIAMECELPAGVFNLVYGRGASTGAALSSHPGVGMLSFTGSVDTGSRIMALAARNITKVNLELGGKAPAIVMADADIDLAVQSIKGGRLLNAGQACNCPERIYVHRSIHDAFVDKLAKAMQASTYGDPLAEAGVDMGPLINAVQAAKVEGMVERAGKSGSEIVVGGKTVERGGGFYFEPTVLVGCDQASEIVQKEVFGPVLPVNAFDTLDEAIDRANDSEYGLTSAIYTRDLSTALRACNELRFGETYINRENFEAMQGFHAGIRHSGLGGADGKHGLYENMVQHIVYLQQ